MLCHCKSSSALLFTFTSTPECHPTAAPFLPAFLYLCIALPAGFCLLSRLQYPSGISSTNQSLVNLSQSISSLTPATGTSPQQSHWSCLPHTETAPGNKNQIIICSVYGRTAVITRKIIILTVLGGQAIFIASHIFAHCITQLEVREEREEVEKR